MGPRKRFHLVLLIFLAYVGAVLMSPLPSTELPSTGYNSSSNSTSNDTLITNISGKPPLKRFRFFLVPINVSSLQKLKRVEISKSLELLNSNSSSFSRLNRTEMWLQFMETFEKDIQSHNSYYHHVISTDEDDYDEHVVNITLTDVPAFWNVTSSIDLNATYEEMAPHVDSSVAHTKMAPNANSSKSRSLESVLNASGRVVRWFEHKFPELDIEERLEDVREHIINQSIQMEMDVEHFLNQVFDTFEGSDSGNGSRSQFHSTARLLARQIPYLTDSPFDGSTEDTKELVIARLPELQTSDILESGNFVEHQMDFSSEHAATSLLRIFEEWLNSTYTEKCSTDSKKKDCDLLLKALENCLKSLDSLELEETNSSAAIRSLNYGYNTTETTTSLYGTSYPSASTVHLGRSFHTGNETTVKSDMNLGLDLHSRGDVDVNETRHERDSLKMEELLNHSFKSDANETNEEDLRSGRQEDKGEEAPVNDHQRHLNGQYPAQDVAVDDLLYKTESRFTSSDSLLSNDAVSGNVNTSEVNDEDTFSVRSFLNVWTSTNPASVQYGYGRRLDLEAINGTINSTHTTMISNETMSTLEGTVIEWKISEAKRQTDSELKESKDEMERISELLDEKVVSNGTDLFDEILANESIPLNFAEVFVPVTSLLNVSRAFNTNSNHKNNNHTFDTFWRLSDTPSGKLPQDSFIGGGAGRLLAGAGRLGDTPSGKLPQDSLVGGGAGRLADTLSGNFSEDSIVNGSAGRLGDTPSGTLPQQSIFFPGNKSMVLNFTDVFLPITSLANVSKARSMDSTHTAENSDTLDDGYGRLSNSPSDEFPQDSIVSGDSNRQKEEFEHSSSLYSNGAGKALLFDNQKRIISGDSSVDLESDSFDRQTDHREESESNLKTVASNANHEININDFSGQKDQLLGDYSPQTEVFNFDQDKDLQGVHKVNSTVLSQDRNEDNHDHFNSQRNEMVQSGFKDNLRGSSSDTEMKYSDFSQREENLGVDDHLSVDPSKEGTFDFDHQKQLADLGSHVSSMGDTKESEHGSFHEEYIETDSGNRNDFAAPEFDLKQTETTNFTSYQGRSGNFQINRTTPVKSPINSHIPPSLLANITPISGSHKNTSSYHMPSAGNESFSGDYDYYFDNWHSTPAPQDELLPIDPMTDIPLQSIDSTIDMHFMESGASGILSTDLFLGETLDVVVVPDVSNQTNTTSTSPVFHEARAFENTTSTNLSTQIPTSFVTTKTPLNVTLHLDEIQTQNPQDVIPELETILNENLTTSPSHIGEDKDSIEDDALHNSTVVVERHHNITVATQTHGTEPSINKQDFSNITESAENFTKITCHVEKKQSSDFTQQIPENSTASTEQHFHRTVPTTGTQLADGNATTLHPETKPFSPNISKASTVSTKTDHSIMATATFLKQTVNMSSSDDIETSQSILNVSNHSTTPKSLELPTFHTFTTMEQTPDTINSSTTKLHNLSVLPTEIKFGDNLPPFTYNEHYMNDEKELFIPLEGDNRFNDTWLSQKYIPQLPTNNQHQKTETHLKEHHSYHQKEQSIAAQPPPKHYYAQEPHGSLVDHFNQNIESPEELYNEPLPFRPLKVPTMDILCHSNNDCNHRMGEICIVNGFFSFCDCPLYYQRQPATGICVERVQPDPGFLIRAKRAKISPDKQFQGHCSQEFCSNNGNCYLAMNNSTVCICDTWYFGRRCQIDAMVMVLCILAGMSILSILALILSSLYCLRKRSRQGWHPVSPY